MTEEEILIRAREAAIAAPEPCDPYCDEARQNIRCGHWDYAYGIPQAARALRDLSKPLSEIQPVDPDEAEAARMYEDAVLGTDRCPTWRDAMLRALKRGRELERAKP